MNTVKTALLMVGLTALLVAVGGLWGRNGMMLFFGLAMVMNLGSYWFSDKIVLKMYGAQEVTESDAPVLYQVTRDLARKANMPNHTPGFSSFREMSQWSQVKRGDGSDRSGYRSLDSHSKTGRVTA